MVWEGEANFEARTNALSVAKLQADSKTQQKDLRAKWLKNSADQPQVKVQMRTGSEMTLT